MNIVILNYDQLTEEEKKEAPDNGMGKDYAYYMRVTWDDGTTECFSDSMEPEDALFVRDLAWIPTLVHRAYRKGIENAC